MNADAPATTGGCAAESRRATFAIVLMAVLDKCLTGEEPYPNTVNEKPVGLLLSLLMRLRTPPLRLMTIGQTSSGLTGHELRYTKVGSVTWNVSRRVRERAFPRPVTQVRGASALVCLRKERDASLRNSSSAATGQRP